MRLHLCVITYNNAEILPAIWQSWVSAAAKNTQLALNWHILDNASHDQTPQVLETLQATQPLSGTVNFFRSSENLGFGKGVNLSLNQISLTDNDWVFLLNPDMLLSEDWFLKLSKIIKHWSPETLAWAPKIIDLSGKIQGNYGPKISGVHEFMELSGLANFFGHGRWWRNDQMTDIKAQTQQNPGWLGGGALLFPGTSWKQVGAFDERFFLYLEDVDWGQRALKFGTLKLDKQIYLKHLGQASTGGDSARGRWLRWQFQKSSAMVLHQKYFSWPAQIGLKFVMLFRTLIELIRSKI